MCCWCFCLIHFEILRCILECCHMIDCGPGIIPVCSFSCPSGVTFFLLFLLWCHLGKSYWCIHFSSSHIIFDHFIIFGVTVKSWPLIGWEKLPVFLGSLVEFIWVCLYNRHPLRLCIGEWVWLQCTFHLGSFLVHFLDFLLAYLPDWHPRRYCWGVCFSRYLFLGLQFFLVSIP